MKSPEYPTEEQIREFGQEGPREEEISPERREVMEANEYFEQLLARLAELKIKDGLSPEEQDEMANLEEQAEAFNDDLGGEIVEISER